MLDGCAYATIEASGIGVRSSMINFVKEAWVKETEPAKRESLATLQSELRKAK